MENGIDTGSVLANRGLNYGFGYGTVSTKVDDVQRDVLKNNADNALMHCMTDRNVDNKFAFANLESANQTSDIKDKVDGESDTLLTAIQANREQSAIISNNISERVAAAELRAERRSDRFDDKLCQLEKGQAVIATKQDSNHQAVMSEFAHQKELNELRDKLNASQRVNELNIYGGCRPALAPNCGTPCGGS